MMKRRNVTTSQCKKERSCARVRMNGMTIREMKATKCQWTMGTKRDKQKTETQIKCEEEKQTK